ncbi:MAG: 16S rRNA (guanine(527)-N(7))-methyltransferase RsmG [Prevotellaceae bacterium]|jgi:16S rRNA (guanine527-N7)-methyltransferase|nr:16S rRNA (guanine(527)-N(7))-methyltransferase RsmG [Prevotellaceae bacterium]
MDSCEILGKYFPHLADIQTERFEQLKDLYSGWNRRINVISRKDIDYLYTRHILHSLSIAKIFAFEPMTEILDIGTGGGFPAVPLAIMFPETNFTAIDSVGKKIKVLEDVVKNLGLTNVAAKHERAENISEKFDFVTGRAVAGLPDFVGMAVKNIKRSIPGGIICLKGGDLTEELQNTVKKYSMPPCRITEYQISDFFEESFFATKKIIHLTFDTV